MANNWLTEIHESLDGLNVVAGQLSHLAQAFAMTGNMYVSGRLAALAEQVDVDRERIFQAVGSKIDGDYRQSQVASAEMLHGLLRVASAMNEEE